MYEKVASTRGVTTTRSAFFNAKPENTTKKVASKWACKTEASTGRSTTRKGIKIYKKNIIRFFLKKIQCHLLHWPLQLLQTNAVVGPKARASGADSAHRGLDVDLDGVVAALVDALLRRPVPAESAFEPGSLRRPVGVYKRLGVLSIV